MPRTSSRFAGKDRVEYNKDVDEREGEDEEAVASWTYMDGGDDLEEGSSRTKKNKEKNSKRNAGARKASKPAETDDDDDFEEPDENAPPQGREQRKQRGQPKAKAKAKSRKQAAAGKRAAEWLHNRKKRPERGADAEGEGEEEDGDGEGRERQKPKKKSETLGHSKLFTAMARGNQEALKKFSSSLVEPFKEEDENGQLSSLIDFVNITFEVAGFPAGCLKAAQLSYYESVDQMIQETHNKNIQSSAIEAWSPFLTKKRVKGGKGGAHKGQQYETEESALKENFGLFWRNLPSALDRETLTHSFARRLIKTITPITSLGFRHIRWAAAFAMVSFYSGLLTLREKCKAECDDASRQLQSEEAKGAKKNKRTVEMLQTQIGKINSTLASLHELMEEIFKGVFVVRFSDVFDTLRQEMIRALASWVRQLPKEYLDAKRSKYLGWALFDQSAAVRREVVTILAEIQAGPHWNLLGLQGETRKFSEYYKERLVELCRDVDPGVQTHAIQICSCLSERDILLEEHTQDITDLIWSDSVIGTLEGTAFGPGGGAFGGWSEDKDVAEGAVGLGLPEGTITPEVSSLEESEVAGELASFIDVNIFGEKICRDDSGNADDGLDEQGLAKRNETHLRTCIEFFESFSDGNVKLGEHMVAAYWARAPALRDFATMFRMMSMSKEANLTEESLKCLVVMVEASIRLSFREMHRAMRADQQQSTSTTRANLAEKSRESHEAAMLALSHFPGLYEQFRSRGEQLSYLTKILHSAATFCSAAVRELRGEGGEKGEKKGGLVEHILEILMKAVREHGHSSVLEMLSSCIAAILSACSTDTGGDTGLESICSSFCEDIGERAVSRLQTLFEAYERASKEAASIQSQMSQPDSEMMSQSQSQSQMEETERYRMKVCAETEREAVGALRRALAVTKHLGGLALEVTKEWEASEQSGGGSGGNRGKKGEPTLSLTLRHLALHDALFEALQLRAAPLVPPAEEEGDEEGDTEAVPRKAGSRVPFLCMELLEALALWEAEGLLGVSEEGEDGEEKGEAHDEEVEKEDEEMEKNGEGDGGVKRNSKRKRKEKADVSKRKKKKLETREKKQIDTNAQVFQSAVKSAVEACCAIVAADPLDVVKLRAFTCAVTLMNTHATVLCHKKVPLRGLSAINLQPEHESDLLAFLETLLQRQEKYAATTDFETTLGLPHLTEAAEKAAGGPNESGSALQALQAKLFFWRAMGLSLPPLGEGMRHTTATRGFDSSTFPPFERLKAAEDEFFQATDPGPPFRLRGVSDDEMAFMMAVLAGDLVARSLDNHVSGGSLGALLLLRLARANSRAESGGVKARVCLEAAAKKLLSMMSKRNASLFFHLQLRALVLAFFAETAEKEREMDEDDEEERGGTISAMGLARTLTSHLGPSLRGQKKEYFKDFLRDAIDLVYNDPLKYGGGFFDCLSVYVSRHYLEKDEAKEIVKHLKKRAREAERDGVPMRQETDQSQSQVSQPTCECPEDLRFDSETMKKFVGLFFGAKLKSAPQKEKERGKASKGARAAAAENEREDGEEEGEEEDEDDEKPNIARDKEVQRARRQAENEDEDEEMGEEGADVEGEDEEEEEDPIDDIV